ncbi:MAG: DUF1552 domain-containing protein [Myxococcota bacterium]
MSRMMRRRFLQSLGLGAGAAVLMPVARTLIDEADGQASERKRALIFVNGVMNERLWTPEASLDQLFASDWLEPLADRRSEMRLLDNLHCRIKSGDSNDFETNHGLGYGYLSCVRPNGSPKDLAPPRGMTIDQYLAERLSVDAPRKSVLFGISHHGRRRGFDEEMNLFARGSAEPLPHAIRASVLFARLFGTVEDADADPGREQRLTDLLREDIGRLSSRLAGAERERLESYLAAFEEFDARRGRDAALSCETPEAPTEGNEEYQMARMMEMATIALQCGITNVVAVNCGATDNHNNHMPQYEGHEPFEVHGSDAGVNVERQHVNPIRQIWKKNAAWIATLMDRLESTPEGDGNALDGTLVTISSARGIRNDTHHAPITSYGRFPVAVLGRTGLNLDGSSHRFEAGEFGMVDFWRTCCAGLGLCGDDFAPGALDSRGLIDMLGASAC